MVTVVFLMMGRPPRSTLFPFTTLFRSTLDGVLATVVLLLESVTVAPPDGAAALNVTVPVEEFPPVTLVGLRVSEERETVAGAEADASNSRTAGLGSVCEIATNFDGEII